MKTAVIYVRVSTEAQERDGTSLDTQEDACRKYAQAKGYTVIEIVRETRSGGTLARIGLDRVREMASRREMQAVIVYAQDRLSRTVGNTYVLLEEFEQRQVTLLFATESNDKTSEGMAVFGMNGVFKEYERAKIAERTRRGKNRRAEEGQVLPAPRGTYGYSYIPTSKTDRENKGGRYEIMEEEADYIRMIYRLYTEDKLTRDGIANRLNELGVPTPRGGRHWRPTSIGHMLTNETYAGVYNWGMNESVVPDPRREQKPERERRRTKSAQIRRPSEEWIPVSVPPIITREMFDAAKERLALNKQNSPRRTKHSYLLRGMIFCGKCGYRYSGGSSHGYKFYTCSGKRPPQNHKQEDRCRNKDYTSHRIERLIWSSFTKLLAHPDRLSKPSNPEEEARKKERALADLKRLELEEQKIKKDRKQALEAFKAEAMSLEELKADQEETNRKLLLNAQKREEAERRCETIRVTQLSAQTLKVLSRTYRAYLLRRTSFEYKRHLLEKAKVSITVEGEQVILEGVFGREVLSLAGPPPLWSCVRKMGIMGHFFLDPLDLPTPSRHRPKIGVPGRRVHNARLIPRTEVPLSP